MTSNSREGYGWMELITVAIATCIPLWLHFESKSWTSASESPMIFLFITLVGVLMCGFIATAMFVQWYGHRPRREHNDLSPNYLRDDLL